LEDDNDDNNNNNKYASNNILSLHKTCTSMLPIFTTRVRLAAAALKTDGHMSPYLVVVVVAAVVW
jgi:hypothetical protein